jgi:GntR family transcriptional regulator
LYLQVRDALLDSIKNGTWRPGDSLPSEIDLHRQLGVSLGTMRRALGVLEDEQLIVREPGRGTFVRACPAGRAPGRFDPMRAEDGAPLVGEVRSMTIKVALPTSAERAALTLAEGDHVVRIDRARFHDERPFAHEQEVLPDRRFPGLSGQATVPGDLEELTRAWGILVVRATGKIRIAAATPAAAAALSLSQGTPLLSLQRVAFDTDDQPVEMMTAYYDPGAGYCTMHQR